MESKYSFDENEEGEEGENDNDGSNDDSPQQNSQHQNISKIGLLESVRRRFQSKDIGRQFWMPDSTSLNCFDCATKFTTIRRRHHCRICGQIFCNNCCNEMIDSKLITTTNDSTTTNNQKISGSHLLRVCKYCYNKLQNIVVEKAKKSNNNNHNKSMNSEKSLTPSPIRKKSLTNRKLSTSSIGDSAVRFAKANLDDSDTITIERQGSLLSYKSLRPSSSSSISYDPRFLINSTVDDQDSHSIISCSFDDVRAMLDELDETIDAREPNWVKEIVEEAKLRQAKLASTSLTTLQSSRVDEDKENNNINNDTNSTVLASIDPNNKNNNNAHSNDIDNLKTEEEIDSTAKINFNGKKNESILIDEKCDKIIKYEPLSASLLEVMINNNNNINEKTTPKEILLNNNLIDLEKFFYRNVFFTNNETKQQQQEQNLNEKNFTNVFQFPIEIHKSELASRIINTIYDRHSEKILQQILKDEKMSLDWLPVLNDISKKIVDNIKLPKYYYLYSIDNYYQNIQNNNSQIESNDNYPYLMDIRKRVKIKSILNGSKQDCQIVNGLVFNKNVANKKMRTDIDQPRILLFACSISYDERIRSQSDSKQSFFKLTLFDSMRLQENNYILNLVAKILTLKPDLIFCQGTVCQQALELLREKDITVILNVKRSILDRIAFFTNSELIHSQEMILNTTKVGQCRKFRLKEFVQQSTSSTTTSKSSLIPQEDQMSNKIRLYYKNIKKTLLFLEGCQDNIGCSVILRGSSKFEDFKKLKSVLRYMIYIHYNNRLEKAYHQSFNCMPIDSRLECETMAQFYQKIVSINSNNHASSSCLINNINNNNGEMLNKNDNNNNNDNQYDKMLALTIIEDFSDPLRSATLTIENINNEDNTNGINNKDNLELLQMQLNSKKMEEILKTLPLSISPLIQFDLPFLMNENIHKISSLRFYFPIDLLISKRLKKEVTKELLLNNNMTGNLDKVLIEENNFNDEENNVLENIDDDYENFSFLISNRIKLCKNDTSKLLFLNSLTSRYMVIKPHPYLINNDYDFKLKSQQFIADFRAWGAYSRYAPNFFPRSNEIGSNRKTMETINQKQLEVEPLSNPEQQNISVLFSVFSLQNENTFNYCLKPKILDIHYYGQNDMSLGSFLIRHFFFRQSRFNQSTSSTASTEQDQIFMNINLNLNRKIFCPNENCSITMFKHLMRFTHNQGTITIYLNKLNESKKLNVDMPHKILTWTYCTQCQSISEYTEMSPDSLAISFGKFLELKFYGNRHFNYQKFFLDLLNTSNANSNTNSTNDNSRNIHPIPCRHSLHRESYQFFSYDQLVVIFKYEPIGLYEIITPSPVIPITKNHFCKNKMIDDLKLLTEQCHDVFAKIRNEIETIKLLTMEQQQQQQQQQQNISSSSSSSSILPQQPSSTTTATTTSSTTSNQLLQNWNLEQVNLNKLEEFLQIVQQEEQDFIKKIKEIHFKLSVPELEQYNVLELFNLENNVIFIKKFIAQIVLQWNDRIKEFFLDIQRNNKRSNDNNKFISNFVNRFLSNDTTNTNTNTNETKNQDQNSNDGQTNDSNVEEKNNDLNLNESNIENTNDNDGNNINKSPNKLSTIKNKMISKVVPLSKTIVDNNNDNNNNSSASLASVTTTTATTTTASTTSTTTTANTTTASTIFTSKIFTRNTEEIPIVIEMPFDNNNNNSGNNGGNANNNINDNDNGSKQQNQQQQNQMFEHYQLPTYRNISIIVRDRDPGSIIAYSLTTPEYERKLNLLKTSTTITATTGTTKSSSSTESSIVVEQQQQQSQQEKSLSLTTDTNGANATTTSTSSMTKNESSDSGGSGNNNNNSEEINQHIDIQFNDVNGKFYCFIYFAQLFRKFRSLILVDGERSARKAIRNDCKNQKQLTLFDDDLYIYSLANCIPWNALGGKSGSTFLKTRDQRFILKEVSKGELKHFLTFVCDYLKYCERALLEKYPSAFVKVVGVYQISYKNTLNNKGSIHYILVMENLFYECNVSFIYDLKGSMRNRKIDISTTYSSFNNNNKLNINQQQNDESNNDITKVIDEDSTSSSSNYKKCSTISTSTAAQQQSSTVLLDENLRQISIAYPLYLHVHSKIFLMESIHRDSEFLKNHGVMDYSLLVGFDDEHMEYIVGIIDYVRLFNWEKSLESRVKKIANAIDPTVVHPFVYQKRFLDAINDYFTQVPDKWYPFLQLVPLAGMFEPPGQQSQKTPNNSNNLINNNNNSSNNNCDD